MPSKFNNQINDQFDRHEAYLSNKEIDRRASGDVYIARSKNKPKLPSVTIHTPKTGGTRTVQFDPKKGIHKSVLPYREWIKFQQKKSWKKQNLKISQNTEWFEDHVYKREQAKIVKNIGVKNRKVSQAVVTTSIHKTTVGEIGGGTDIAQRSAFEGNYGPNFIRNKTYNPYLRQPEMRGDITAGRYPGVLHGPNKIPNIRVKGFGAVEGGSLEYMADPEILMSGERAARRVYGLNAGWFDSKGNLVKDLPNMKMGNKQLQTEFRAKLQLLEDQHKAISNRRPHTPRSQEALQSKKALKILDRKAKGIRKTIKRLENSSAGYYFVEGQFEEELGVGITRRTSPGSVTKNIADQINSKSAELRYEKWDKKASKVVRSVWRQKLGRMSELERREMYARFEGRFIVPGEGTVSMLEADVFEQRLTVHNKLDVGSVTAQESSIENMSKVLSKQHMKTGGFVGNRYIRKNNLRPDQYEEITSGVFRLNRIRSKEAPFLSRLFPDLGGSVDSMSYNEWMVQDVTGGALPAAEQKAIDYLETLSPTQRRRLQSKIASRTGMDPYPYMPDNITTPKEGPIARSAREALAIENPATGARNYKSYKGERTKLANVLQQIKDKKEEIIEDEAGIEVKSPALIRAEKAGQKIRDKQRALEEGWVVRSDTPQKVATKTEKTLTAINESTKEKAPVKAAKKAYKKIAKNNEALLFPGDRIPKGKPRADIRPRKSIRKGYEKTAHEVPIYVGGKKVGHIPYDVRENELGTSIERNIGKPGKLINRVSKAKNVGGYITSAGENYEGVWGAKLQLLVEEEGGKVRKTGLIPIRGVEAGNYNSRKIIEKAMAEAKDTIAPAVKSVDNINEQLDMASQEQEISKATRTKKPRVNTSTHEPKESIKNIVRKKGKSAAKKASTKKASSEMASRWFNDSAKLKKAGLIAGGVMVGLWMLSRNASTAPMAGETSKDTSDRSLYGGGQAAMPEGYRQAGGGGDSLPTTSAPRVQDPQSYRMRVNVRAGSTSDMNYNVFGDQIGRTIADNLDVGSANVNMRVNDNTRSMSNFNIRRKLEQVI